MPTSGSYDVPCQVQGDPVLDPLAITWEAAWWAGTTFLPPGNNDGDPVYNWVPIVGGIGLALVPVVNPPIFHTASTALNQRPAVRFSGDDWLESAGALAVTQPNSIVLILESPDSDPSQSRWFDNLGLGADRQLVGGWGPQLGAGHVLQTDAAFVPNVPPPFITTRQLVVAVFDGASSYIWQNGVSGALVDASTGGLSGVRIGGDGLGIAGFIGDIAFCGIYSGDVTVDPAWPLFVAQAAVDYGLLV